MSSERKDKGSILDAKPSFVEREIRTTKRSQSNANKSESKSSDLR